MPGSLRSADKYRKTDSDEVVDDELQGEHSARMQSKIIDNTQKMQLLSSLCDYSDRMNEYYRQEKQDRTLKEIIDLLQKSAGTNVPGQSGEEEEWITLGLFDNIFRMLCECDRIPQESIDSLVKIVDILDLCSFENRARAFFDSFFDHLQSYDNCILLLYVLHTLVLRHQNSDKFVELLAGASGINVLLDFYDKKLTSNLEDKPSNSKYSYARRPMVKLGSNMPMAHHIMRSPGRRPRLQTRSYSSLVDIRRTSTTPRDYSQIFGATSPTALPADMLTQTLPATPDIDKKIITSPVNNNAVPTPTVSSPLGLKMNIPKLQLPVHAPEKTNTLSTRSSRRIQHDGHPSTYVHLESLRLSIDTMKTNGGQNQQPREAHERNVTDVFASLSAKLGELYIAGDLTHLVPIRRDLDKLHKADQPNHQDTTLKSTIMETSSEELIVQKVDPMTLITSQCSKTYIKQYLVLSILRRLTENTTLRKFSRSPVNLFMAEINRDRNTNSKDQDLSNENLDIIYHILSQYAQDVEAKYFKLWKSINQKTGNQLTNKTQYDPTRDRALKKYDVFLWRWTGIAEQILENEDWTQLDAQLSSLSRYLKSCTSRVQASQCAAVCLETLLKIQGACRRRSRDATSGQYSFKDRIVVHMTHRLLEIFDHVMDGPERHPLLMEFFYFNLIDNEDNFFWMREYSKFLLTVNPTNGQQSIQDDPLLLDMRLRVMHHFQMLMNLFLDLGAEFLNKHGSSNNQSKKKNETLENQLADESSVMKQFDFLVNPADGLVLSFLTHGPLHYQYPVKREMLMLLEKIFKLPHLPFLKIESYVNTYIRYHFLNFVQLYIDVSNDPITLQTCALHLNVLIAFSVNKTPQIVSRFFTMKTVKFLAREIDLEFEMNERRKRLSHSQQSSKNALESDRSDKSHSDDSDRSDRSDDQDLYSDYSNEDDLRSNKSTPRKPSLQVKDKVVDNEGYPSDESDIETHRSVRVPFSIPAMKGFVTAQTKNLQENNQPEDAENDTASEMTDSHASDHEDEDLKIQQQPKFKMNMPNLSLNSKGKSTTSGEENINLKLNMPSLSLGGVGSKSQPSAPIVPKFNMPGLSLGGVASSKSTQDSNHPSPPVISNSISKLNVPNLSLGVNTKINIPPSTSTKSEEVQIAAPIVPKFNMPGLSLGGVVAIKSPQDSNLASPPVITNSNSIPKFNIPSLSINPSKSESNQSSNKTPRMIQDSNAVVMNQSTKPKISLPLSNINTNQSSVSTCKESPTNQNNQKSKMITFRSSSASSSKRTSRGNLNDDMSTYRSEADTEIMYESDMSDDDFVRTLYPHDHDFHDSMLDANHFHHHQHLDEIELNNLQDLESFYALERSKRKLYQDESIHVAMLALLMSLVMTCNHTLDNEYCDQFPLMKNLLNVPYMLHQHLNDPLNDHMIPKLHDISNQMGLGCKILIKLLCKKLFEPTLYAHRSERLGVGAFGNVWRVTMPFTHSSVKSVAVKLLKVSESVAGNCVLYTIFNEIVIMEKFKGDPRICRLYDYGVDDDYYYIVMNEYKCSLKKWRLKQDDNMFLKNLSLYMKIYKRLLEGFKFLYDNNVNHFDIKCDNVLLEPFDGVDDQEFYSGRSDDFELVIGDFGESFLYSNDEEDGYTMRHRGTECIKSPEMLMIEMMNNKSKFYDRRKKVGANSASDVWSLGCLFYELLSGEFLFDATDFTQFFTLLTKDKPTLIGQERFSKIHYNPLLMDILVYILIRDPLRRPSIQDILQRFNHTWIKAVPQYEKTSVVGVGAGAQENVSIVAVQASEPDYSLPLETPHVVTPVKVNKIHFTSPGAGVLQGGQPMPLQPYPWTKNDTLFYVHKATFVVRNRLYIVSDELANNKSVLNQLGITHVVNCCVGGGNNNQNLLQSNFFYFGMSHSISENSVSAYNEYVRAFEFVRDAIRKRGRVLVYSGKGLSRSGLFVVLYLMNTFNISSYESYLFVKDRRPALRPEILSHFLHFLLRVRKQQQQKNKLLAELQQVGKLKDESAEGSEGLGVDQQPLHSHKKISKINKKIALLLVQHSLKPASPIDANDVSGLLANKRVGRAQSVRVPLPVVPNQTPQKRTKSQHAVDSVSDHGIHWYRCLCGACVVGVVSPFDPIRLHAGNMTFENSPMRSWPGFLQEMRLLYFYDTKYLHMGLTNKDKVLLDPFDVNKHTEVYTEGIPPTPSRKNSGRSSAGSRSGRRGSSRGEVSDEDDDDSDDDEEEIQWIINKCKYCSYMVYARKKEKKVVTKKNLVKDNKATHFSQPPSGGGNVVDQNGRRESLTLHLSGIRENRQGQLRTASAIPAASLQLWSDNGLSNSATPNGEPINEDDLFKSTIKYDIAINTSIKTTQIVTNSNVNGIQDLRPQMFFKGCQ